jgi:hypothetical protein
LIDWEAWSKEAQRRFMEGVSKEPERDSIRLRFPNGDAMTLLLEPDGSMSPEVKEQVDLVNKAWKDAQQGERTEPLKSQEELSPKQTDPEISRRIEAFVKAVEDARAAYESGTERPPSLPREPEEREPETVTIWSPNRTSNVTIRLKPGPDAKRQVKEIQESLAVEEAEAEARRKEAEPDGVDTRC